MSESDELMSHFSPWNKSIEYLLVKYCDQSKCFEWMHSKAYSLYDICGKIEHTNILIEESEKSSLLQHTPISINSK